MSLRSRMGMTGLGLTAILVACAGFTFAQRDESRNPTSLLPAHAVVYFGVDGGLEHQEAWKQTAAYESLVESGLAEAVTEAITSIVEAQEAQLPSRVGEAVSHVWQHGLSFAVTLGEDENQPPMPWSILVLHDAADFEAELSQLARSAAEGKMSLQSRDVNGRSVTFGYMPNTPGIEVGWWSEGGHLVLVSGMNAVASAIAVADGTADITSHPLWESVSGEEPGPVVTARAWLDFTVLRETFGALEIPVPQGDDQGGAVRLHELLAALGLDGLDSIVGRSGYDGRALWSETRVNASAPRQGLMALCTQERMTLEDLPPLPANASGFFSAWSLDWSRTYESLRSTAVEVERLLMPSNQGMVEGLIEQANAQLGIDLKDDLFDALGNVHCIYSDAGQVPMGLGFGVVMEVQDADGLRRTLDHLVGLGERLAEGNLTGRKIDRLGREITLLEVAGGVVSPAYCVGEKWLTIGVVPQTVLAFLMREDGSLPTWSPSDEVQQALDELPDEFTSISVSDPTGTYRFMAGFAPLMLGSGRAALSDIQGRQEAAPPREPGFSIADAPPAELVARPLFPNVTVRTVDDQGVTRTSRKSAPSLPLVGGMGDATGLATTATLTALLLPAVQQAREAARRVQSMNNLKLLLLALHNHHDVFDEFPAGTVPNEDLKPAERLSWIVPVLPYLEQQALYDPVDVDQGWKHPNNEPVMSTQLQVLQNPSNPERESEYGLTDYVGMAGVGKDGPTLPVTHRRAGIFAYDRATTMIDVKDGSSNTIATSEATDGGPWGSGGKATIRPLTQKPYINGPDGLGGNHPGGMVVGFADGAVRFVSEEVDPSILEAAVTINGGEQVRDF